MTADLERKRKFLINTAYYAVLAGIFFLIFRYVIYAVTPFLIAALVTLMLKRPIDNLARSFLLPRRTTAGLTVLLFYIVLSILATWLFTHLLWSLFNWLAAIPAHYADTIEPAIRNILDWYELQVETISPGRTEYIDRLASDLLANISAIISYLSEQALKIARNLAFSIPKFVIASIFCIVSTVFMSLDYPQIKHFILEQLSPEHQRILLESKHYVAVTFGRIITSYAAIMFITMTELYIAFTVIGVEDAIVLSMLIALFDILPALGTGGIMVPWAIITLINKNYTLAAQLFIIYAIITVVRNFIEPKIVGDSIGLHPVLVLMSIFLGAAIFGPLGILIMPFLLIVIKRLNDTGRIQLFKSNYAKPVEEPGFFEQRRQGKRERAEKMEAIREAQLAKKQARTPEESRKE